MAGMRRDVACQPAQYSGEPVRVLPQMGMTPPRRDRVLPRAVRGGFHCAHGKTLLGTGMESPTHASELIRQLALWSVPLLAAVIFHEVAHGVVALRLGDDTAQRAGRLTLNPLPHIDPIDTVLLPALLLVAGAPVFTDHPFDTCR